MSTLKLTGSSSGSTSLTAPASGSDRAIAFPDAAGTVALGNTAKIIQVVAAEEANTINSPGSWTTFFDLDVTPVSASSKFIVHLGCHILIAGGQELHIKCIDGTYTSGLHEIKNAEGNDIKFPGAMTWFMDQSHSTGSATTFSVQGYDNGSSGTTVMGNASSAWKSTMVVLEVLV